MVIHREIQQTNRILFRLKFPVVNLPQNHLQLLAQFPLLDRLQYPLLFLRRAHQVNLRRRRLLNRQIIHREILRLSQQCRLVTIPLVIHRVIQLINR